MTRSKDIGTAAESAVVKVFKDAGFRAKRLTLHGSKDVGDIDIGLDSVVIEVKGGKAAESASDGQVWDWLYETDRERENASAAIGVLVLKRKGVGYGRAGDWWAVLYLNDLQWLLVNDHHTPGPVTPVRLHLKNLIPLLQRLT